MKTSKAGLDLVKEYEGLRLVAYLCPAGVWTIGYGRTAGVKEGDTCTEAQADAGLLGDIRASEEAVDRLVTVPLTQPQFDALVSFVFNLGEGRLKGSTLLRLLNAGHPTTAAMEFDRWVYAGGVPLSGLKKRRAAERALFESGLAKAP